MSHGANLDGSPPVRPVAFDRRTFVVKAIVTSSAIALSTGAVVNTSAATQASIPAASDPAGTAGTEEGHPMASASDHYALDDAAAEAVWFLGTLALIKGVSSQTGGSLATVEFTHPPGFATPLHVHHTADEAFYVLEGRMRGLCGDTEWSATTGSFVWLPREIPHGYAVEGDELLRTLAVALPAGFDRFIVEAGEPAQDRTLPPPMPPDIEKLVAVGTKYGIENLGPPIQFTDAPTA